MRYTSAAAFRHALETRLRAVSHSQGTSLVRLRKSVAFDRLLARLVAAARGRWILKGGLALDYRFGAAARPTKDIDLAVRAGEEAATTDLLAAAALDLGDFFTYSIERTTKLDQLLEGSAGHIVENGPGITLVSDGDNIDPGKTQTRKVDLTQPGTYLFVCNIPGHFKAGMFTVVTVGP